MGLNLIGKIELDGAGFERGLHRAGEHVTDFAKNAAVAAFGFYGVEESIRKTVETATELVNESKRLDLTVEQLQLLRQAAKDGGTEMDTLASAFEKLNIARQKALSGSKEGQEILASFQKLGVSRGQLQTQTAASIFTGPLAQAVGSHNVADISKELKDVLGKAFGASIPVLKTDFEELSDKMHKLGTIMDADMAVKLKAMGDNLGLLENVLAVHVGPAILLLGEWILKAVGGLKQLSAFLGAITSKGILKGVGTVAKASNDAFIDILPDVLAKPLHKATEKYYDTLFGVNAKESDEILTQAGDAANEVSADWKKMMDELHARMAAEADALKHPKPIVPAIDQESKKAVRKMANLPSDSLLRVGNFLGSNGQTIERVNQRKISLMKDHLRVLNKIEQKLPSSGGNFGLGIPLV